MRDPRAGRAVQDELRVLEIWQLGPRSEHRSVAPYIREVIAGGEYPEFSRRVHDAEDQDDDQRFTFGLACVLDGIAATATRTQ